MRYISRDTDNKITGSFARPQDFAQETIQDDDPELLLFLNPPKTWQELRQEDYEAKGWLTVYDLIDDILDRGTVAVKIDRDAIKLSRPKI